MRSFQVMNKNDTVKYLIHVKPLLNIPKGKLLCKTV
jgi:hypothetical protein